jgi:hypothetical protein
MASNNGISVEKRLSQLEEEVRHLREAIEKASDPQKTGWRSIVGTHENDPDFDEVVRLGKEIRDKDLVMVWRKRKVAKTKRKSPAGNKLKIKE